ncbi:MAG: hypothetical protein AAGI53_17220 [Planctomycetota bacterium]
MNFLAGEIPESDEALARWLEEQIVGLRLHELVAQLLAVEENDSSVSLDEKLSVSAVLSDGLGAASPEQVRELLYHPRLLLRLQDLVLREGSPYWSTVERSPEHLQAAQELLSTARESIIPPATPASEAARASVRAWLAPLAIAASLLIVAGIRRSNDPLKDPGQPTPAPNQIVKTGWGFERSDLLTQDVSAEQYLESLADAANEWFVKRPRDANALRDRLQAFRKGCDTLIAAPHEQLEPGDQQWLVESCQAWRVRLETLITAAGADDAEILSLLSKSDDLIDEIVADLESRV